MKLQQHPSLSVSIQKGIRKEKGKTEMSQTFSLAICKDCFSFCLSFFVAAMRTENKEQRTTQHSRQRERGRERYDRGERERSESIKTKTGSSSKSGNTGVHWVFQSSCYCNSIERRKKKKRKKRMEERIERERERMRKGCSTERTTRVSMNSGHQIKKKREEEAQHTDTGRSG